MGMFDWLKGSRRKPLPAQPRPAPAVPAPAARPTPTELRERLWHVTAGREVKSLVDSLRDEEAAALVATIDLDEIPLNAFCTQAFNFKGLDDRMVVTTILTLRLLEMNRKAWLLPLLEKLERKFGAKIERGGSLGGPAYKSSDPWRVGESLMLETHTLAIELLKRGGYDRPAATLLEAVLLDYPDRLESRFWLAAARHNLYMQSKSPESKLAALQAIDSFIEAAENHPDYRGNVEALKSLRRTEY